MQPVWSQVVVCFKQSSGLGSLFWAGLCVLVITWVVVVEIELEVMRLTTDRSSEGLLPNSGRGMVDKSPDGDHGHREKGQIQRHF